MAIGLNAHASAQMSCASGIRYGEAIRPKGKRSRSRGRPTIPFGKYHDWERVADALFKTSSVVKACELVKAEGGLADYGFRDGALELLRVVRDAETIRARFNEALKLYRADPAIAAEWDETRIRRSGSYPLRCRCVPTYFFTQLHFSTGPRVERSVNKALAQSLARYSDAADPFDNEATPVV
jgi:hypothetical protein